MKKLSTNNENTNVSYKNEMSINNKEEIGISKKYNDLQDRFQKIGTAFLLLEDIFHYSHKHVSETCETLGMSFIKDSVFYKSMSLSQERDVLYNAVKSLDQGENLLRVLLSLGKISPMNFMLIQREIVFLSKRVNSLLSQNDEKRLSQAGSLFGSDRKTPFMQSKLESLFKEEEIIVEQRDIDNNQKKHITKKDNKNISTKNENLKEETIQIRGEFSDSFVEARRTSILEFVRSKPVASFTEIRGEFSSFHSKTLQRDIKALLEEKLLSSSGASRWTVYRAL